MKKPRLLSAVSIIIFIYSNAAMAASFTPLGDIGATGVSGDGSVIVGTSYSTYFDGEAVRWTNPGGMVGLGDLPGGRYLSNAHGVSGDGSVVVGISESTFGFEAFCWTSAGGMVGLGVLPSGDYYSSAEAVSGDGSVVVGTSYSIFDEEAFRWTSTGGMVGLGDLPGGYIRSSAQDVSDDGSVVVGQSHSALGDEAFIWTSSGGMMGLGQLPGGSSHDSSAEAVSGDGSVVVGQSTSAFGREAFIWTSSGGMRGLGTLAWGIHSDAYDVSNNGSVVVGISYSKPSQAIFWTSTGGMRSVASHLIAAGVDLAGWELTRATWVSADGSTIVGSGYNPDNGDGGAWIATFNTFYDVALSHWAYSFIETLATSGITSGCDATHYCPDDQVTRAQMAVFLERGMRGSGYNPDPGVGNIFLDVPASYWAAGWIELLYMDGITSGCGSNNYCPGDTTTRAQMAVFLLRAKYGQDYAPPTPVGVFNDVPLTNQYADWVEQLAAEGITGGCGNGNYCPNAPVTRDQMAVFLVRTFGLE